MPRRTDFSHEGARRASRPHTSTPRRVPLADLHTHTTFSDGRLSPASLVEKAALRGLGALAITDHDTVAAHDVASLAAARHGIGLITGVELSADFAGRDAHILGYGFDPAHEGLRAHLARFRQARVARAQAMVARLARLGAPITWERVAAIAGSGAVGRPHVAQALVEAGHVDTMAQAFDRFVGEGAPAYVQKAPIHPFDSIRLIHAAGGAAVLAHPGATFTAADVAELARAGLDGLEVVHPSHSDEMRAHWAAVAARYALVTTGGSDYHGYRPFEEEHFGTYGIEPEQVAALLARRRQPAPEP